MKISFKKIHILIQEQVNSQVREQTGYQVNTQVSSHIYSQVWDQTREQVWYPVDAKTHQSIQEHNENIF